MKKVLYTLLYIAFAAFLASPAYADTKINRYMFVADSLFDNKEYEDAFRVYGLAMKEDINNPTVLLRAAECAYILGHTPVAQSYYSLCLQKGGNVADVINDVLDCFCKDKSADCLTETLDDIVQKHPKKEGETSLVLARHFFGLKEYETALHFIRKCPASAETEKMLAISLFQTGDLENAKPLFKSINESGIDFDAAVFEGNLHLVKAKNIINDCKDTIPRGAVEEELSLAKFNLTKAYIMKNNNFIKSQLDEIDRLTNLINESK